MQIKKHIPNAITCGNLFCGCLAIIFAFKGNLVGSAYLVGIAAVLDFFDGFSARLLKVHSEIGKQLDSLADMVTFGLVPALIMFFLLSNAASYDYTGKLPTITKNSSADFPWWLVYSSFLIAIFSAVRLAKFNIDTRQSHSFIGLPTPASAILICSFPLIRAFQPDIGNLNINAIIENPWILFGFILLISYLMVAELPLFAFKFKSFGWTDNKIRYSFIVISFVSILFFQFIAIPLIIFLYLIFSIINNFLNKQDSAINQH